MRLIRGNAAKRNRPAKPARPAPRNAARLLAAVGASALGTGLFAGCQNGNPLDIKSFIDPSELAGRVRKDTLVVKILNQVDPAIEEPNREFVTAQPPTQDDLAVNATDYVISKNDLLSIEISDLGGQGTNTVQTKRVTESGSISLPFVGQIQAEGKTEFELQRTIEDTYRTANILNRAQVSVSTVEARGRAISILGAVSQPGQYALVDPDFRVLDALTLARDTTSPLVTDLYIIRRTDLSRPSTRPAGAATAPDAGGTPMPAPATKPAGGAGVDDLKPQGMAWPQGGPAGRGPGLTMANPTAPAAARISVSNIGNVGRVKAVPLGPITPVLLSDAAAAPGNPAQFAQAAPAGGPADENGHFIYVDGKKVYIDSPPAAGTPAPTAGTATPPPAAPTPTPAPAMTPPPAAASMPAPAMTPPAAPAPAVPMAPANTTPSGNFTGFRDLAAPDNVRVIRIPLDRLRNGDLQYNVVIKPKDMIVVQNLPIGEYYMGGHVGKPSAYTLTQRKITLKQAVISAGMLDQLAIPERTDVVRRLPDNKEVFVRVNLAKIFEGEAPDIYLKPDDQIMVGTNFLAPFIAALRGAFRFTYGFGFLYDRNFAAEENNRTSVN